MKKLLRSFFINLLAFIFVWKYLPFVELTGPFETLLLASLVLTLLDKFLKPILKTFFLPINFFTFGLFRWVVTVAIFYLTTQIVNGLVVTDFYFPGLQTDFLILPEKNIPAQWWGYVISSFFVVLLSRFINWVFKKKC